MSDRDYMHWNFGGGIRESFWSMYRGTKGVVVALIAIHVAMAIVYAAGGLQAWAAVVDVLGLRKDAILKGWIWQLLTMGLFHDLGILHLLFNCIFVWIFGRMVESRLTLKQFLVFCGGATVLGSVVYVAVAVIADTAGVALGASGFCMGLTVLAACWFPTMEIHFWGIFRLQLWVLAAILVLVDLLNTLYNTGGVAYAAHLGGAAYGWIYYRHGTRIEGVLSGIDRMADKAAHKKQRKAQERSREVRAEVDRILDKVNREGMTALTDAERKFLKNASKKLGG